MELVREKIAQVPAILKEHDIDVWLLFVRETQLQADPVLPLLIGNDVTWQSFFVYTRAGDAIALVGNFDQDIFTRSGCFSEVHTYVEGAEESIRNLLEQLNPTTIAVNYSKDNPAADGLTHGMYLLLQDYLDSTPFARHLISAAPVCTALRSRKTPTEIEHVARAAHIANEVWDTVHPKVMPGMSEIEIARLIDTHMIHHCVMPSFDTIVNAGDKTSPGHGHPTGATIAAGDLLHIDFGVRYEGYCSDIQRLLYFHRPGERTVPQELSEAFLMVRDIITECATLCKPGTVGADIDTHAREMLTEAAYPVYEHALGHQLGRAVHDGGAIIGPRWERYGDTPDIPLDENNLFTLELEIILPGIGCVGLEEDVCITPNGAQFLCPRQMELTTR